MNTITSPNLSTQKWARSIPAFALFACMAFTPAQTQATQGYRSTIRASVDGVRVRFPDIQPMMIDGAVMVPIRGVFEKMDATMEWDDATQTVMAQHGADTIRLTIDSNVSIKNGNQVQMSVPAVMRSGRAMVPLRFLGESLGARVAWLGSSRTVSITTGMNREPFSVTPVASQTLVAAGTVIPFRLRQTLGSATSSVGDEFRATLDAGDNNYMGIPRGSILEGHVALVVLKAGNTPGLIGLAFERVVMPNGQSFIVNGSLFSTDSADVTGDSAHMTAKMGNKYNSMRFVGYGTGRNELLSVVTNKNPPTNEDIDAAVAPLRLGVPVNPALAHNVVLYSSTRIGVRLNGMVRFRRSAISGN